MVKRSSIILAGGRGKRMGDQEKALLQYKGRTLIEHIIDVLDPLVEEIVVSVRDARQQSLLEPYIKDRVVVMDQFKGIGPLAGIVEGLRTVNGKYTFLTACDMPHLNACVVELLFKTAIGHDAALPVHDNKRFEPLHAVYCSGPMLAATQKAIEMNEGFILAPISELEDVVVVGMKEIQKIDAKLGTFINVNTWEDVEKMVKGL